VAKTRAQRKAERRKREQQAQRQQDSPRDDEARAQHATQVPESADVVEAELVERSGATPPDLVKQTDVLGQELSAPAPSRADSAREQRRLEKAEQKEMRKREKEEARAADERKRVRAAARTPEQAEERQRGAVISFLLSSWAELKRVQWPERDTLVQASAVTVIFISVAAAYLGLLDAAFNWFIKQIL
jgi:preprotein translocase SecE subunit